MTRKDYVLLSATLRRAREAYGANWDPNLFRACTDHAKAIARALLRDNPRFEADRFLRDASVPPSDIYYAPNGKVEL
jgi:hypothetical protein